MKARKSRAIIAIALATAVFGATPAFAGVTINGSGATFAGPLIDVCKADFNKDTGNTVNYSGGGSGKGRTDFSGGLVDFAGSDAPYSSGEPANLVYAPVYAAPIAIMYNIPGIKESIYLSPSTIAQIFSGYITNWDDKQIAADNARTVKTPVFETKKVNVTVKGKKTTKVVPVLDAKGKPKIKSYKTTQVNIDLPKSQITVWYRTDSSGTSENFTNFLNKTASDKWTKAKNAVFANSTPRNIATQFNFQGASGSAAVAAGVKSKEGSIGYGELSFALATSLQVANVQNAAGEFVKPEAAGVSAFLGGGTINANGTVAYDFAKSIPGAYPLGVTSYGLAYASGKDAAKQKAVAEWFSYVLTKCPSKYPEKGFSTITGPLATKATEQIAKIK